MIETYNYSDLSHVDKFIAAGVVAAWTHPSTQNVIGESGSALVPVELEDILVSDLALVSFVQDSFAGFIRAKNILAHQNQTFREIGSLVVLRNFRGMGVGTHLVRTITERTVDENHLPYAFCGPESDGIFEKAGYSAVAADQLPPDAVSQKGNQAMLYTKSQTAESTLSQ